MHSIIMKPTYCSGGTIITGRLPNLNNTSRKKYSARREGDDKNAKVQSRISAPKRQESFEENNNNYNSCCPTARIPSRPSSPFIVYRSAKYVTPHARILKTVRGYAKYYIVLPALLLADRCKHLFYQLCGLLLLFVASPLWILILLGLFITRRLRLFLIQRFYPGLQAVDYCNNRSCEANESIGLDIVNSLVWTRGKLDIDTIKNRFKLLFAENENLQHLLRLKLVTKFGETLWETCDDMSLDNHIVEAPKMYHSYPIVDEPLKELYRTGSNKSILQKYISYCISLPLECSAPPWKIHVVSYISRDDGIKEKTCLVIRMHVALIKNRYVRKALRELFVNPTPAREDSVAAKQNELDVHVSSGVPCNSDAVIYDGSRKGEIEIISPQKPLWNLEKFRDFCIGDIIKEISVNHRKNFGVWINLRLKQLEFHSKTIVLSIILVDMKNTLKRCAASLEVIINELWSSFLFCVKYVIEMIQALAAVPMIILGSLVWRSNFRKLELQRNANAAKRLISWTDLLHGDLIEEICKTTGTTSSGNVIMMACSYALRDYYQQNNIPDPGKLGFTVGNAMHFTSAMSLKAIDVPCNARRYPLKTTEELQTMEDALKKYPKWKVLGLWYTMRYCSYFMPTCLAQKVQRRIVCCYPFTFSHVNMKSVDSFLSCQEAIHQIYGEIVEEFSFFQPPPLADFGVSITLVQYSGRTRLFVMSPFQSMDTILTQRCNQYLIKIAEDVGVERSKIPYSRRSSPASTSGSTPKNPPFILNHSENCNLILN